MRRWSIKARIIFWYTFFFALLIGLDFYLLKTSATQILNEQANRQLLLAVDEIAPTLQIEDDGVYIENSDDEGMFTFYHDGVYFLIYQNGQAVYGTPPSGFDATDTIQLNTSHTQNNNGLVWLVYDVPISGDYVVRGMYDMNIITNSFKQIILTAGLLSPIIILLSAIGGLIIITRSFKPIKYIYQTASDIKNEEDYSKRIPLNKSKDEVHELAEMVNQMLDKVEQSISREKQFSSNVSHELRTPLTVMQAQAEYMLDHAKTNDNKDEIKTIMSQISFMENIVTQLLEITRSKQISQSDMEVIDIYELIQLTIDSLSSQLEKKQINLTLEQPNFITNVRSNQTLMIRVFSNLITNAIKYNKDNGIIHISFSKKNKYLFVSVADKGIGIPEEHLEKIFDPFYRVDESRTQQDFSLGLGLPMVREVLRIHGGDVSVESVEGIGTTFQVELPLSE